MNFQSKSIISAILVIMVLAVGYFAVLPRWNDYTAARQQLADVNDVHDKLVAAQNEMNAFLAEYHSHAAEASMINRALPLNQPQVYQILKNLDELAKGSGLTLSDLNVLDNQSADTLGAAQNTIQPLDINFSLVGPSALAFKDFLTKLEANLRIMDIQSVQMEGAGGDTKSMKTTFKFRTYYQK